MKHTITGRSTINMHNMDCMEFMAEKPDNYYKLAIVDPPYGIGVNVSMGRRKGDKKSNYHKFAGGDTDAPPVEYFEQLKRVSENQIIWGANHFINRMPWNSAAWVLWDKGFSNDVSFAVFEMAYTSLGGTTKKFEQHPNKQHRIHPTEKPIALYKWLLQNYAKEGDNILDTHGGSMSLAIACWDDQFDLDVTELDKDYFQSAKKRLDEHTRQLQFNF